MGSREHGLKDIRADYSFKRKLLTSKKCRQCTLSMRVLSACVEAIDL